MQAIAKAAPKKPPEETPEAKAARELAEVRKAGNRTTALLAVGAVLTLLVGAVAPVSFMQHFIVFALACFVGFHVIWNVAHALHTPLMAITNAHLLDHHPRRAAAGRLRRAPSWCCWRRSRS